MESFVYSDEFKEYLDFEKGLSTNTVKSYLRDLKSFFLFFEDKKPEFFEEKDLIYYSEYMKSKYAMSTVLRKMASIRIYFNYLRKNNGIKDISENIINPKRERKIPEILSLKDIKMILLAIGNTLEEKKDKILISLFIATGCRVSEIVKLKIDQIDEKYEFIKVIGKGNKYRLVPLYKEIGIEFKNYIENIRPVLKKEEISELVFLGMTRQVFWHKLKKYAKKAEIKKNVYPHLFRHSFATFLLENGADIRVVQELLGHVSIGTTEIYTHLNKKEIKRIYNSIGIGDF